MNSGPVRKIDLGPWLLRGAIGLAVLSSFLVAAGGQDAVMFSILPASLGSFCLLLWGLWGGIRQVRNGAILAAACFLAATALGSPKAGGIWIVVGGVLAIVGWFTHWASGRKTGQGEERYACPHCGYLLMYLDVQRCPECGRPFTFQQLGVYPEKLHFGEAGGTPGAGASVATRQSPGTYLCVPIIATDTQKAKADVDRAIAAGADCLELRVDMMVDANPVAVMQYVGGRAPVLITHRSREEGGFQEIDDQARITRLVELGTHDPGLIDCEWATWQRSANIRQKIGLVTGKGTTAGGGGPGDQSHGSQSRGTRKEGTCSAAAGSHRNRLILSAHDFAGRPADLAERVRAMAASPADVVKVAWKAGSIVENFEAFRLMRESAKPVIAICMGQAGVPSRVLAGKFGAFLSFAALDDKSGSAPGQVTVEDMHKLYRWPRLGPKTKVYGVIACPVTHSMSPAIHNAAFDQVGYDGVYLPLHVEPPCEAFAEFMNVVLANRWADFCGFSVTIPHKENALRWLKGVGGRIEPLAERIAAVNTIAIDPDGAVHGLNTDYAGALDAITGITGLERADLAGMSAAVLGARGTARAIVAGLVDCGCRVTIYNRTADKAAELAAAFGCGHAPWEDRVRLDARLVLNTTSIGMHRADEPGAEAESPLPAEALRAGMIVFDAVYNPPRTRLLADAADRGCRCVDGVAMFVAQAAAQFERWTGAVAPRELMKQVVLRRLGVG